MDSIVFFENADRFLCCDLGIPKLAWISLVLCLVFFESWMASSIYLYSYFAFEFAILLVSSWLLAL